MVVPGRVAADAVLRWPGGPFRELFCKQSLPFSSGRGGRQFGYAGLACRFVSGFVSNLLRFPPDGGARQLGYAGLAGRFDCGFVSNILRGRARRILGEPGDAGIGAPGTRDEVHRGRGTRSTGCTFTRCTGCAC